MDTVPGPHHGARLFFTGFQRGRRTVAASAAPPGEARFFHKTRLCAAIRQVQDDPIETARWRHLMELWVLLLSIALGIATYALYRLVDLLRDKP
jgi:hypothetical protein